MQDPDAALFLFLPHVLTRNQQRRCGHVLVLPLRDQPQVGPGVLSPEAVGVSLPRTTFQQVDVGTPVYSLNSLQPGDLLFTAGSDGTAEDPGHVGMYIGSGLVIQAPETASPL
jgi:hypothetical protein